MSTIAYIFRIDSAVKLLRYGEIAAQYLQYINFVLL